MNDEPRASRVEEIADETRRLLRLRKRKVAEAVVNDQEIPTSELAAIMKLELQVVNLEAYERLRAMTSKKN